MPSWIQTPSYLLSDSLKNTLPPLWLLTQTNSIWCKLIHSDSTWWWQPSWIWPSWIQPPLFFLSNSLTLARIGSHHLHKKTFSHLFWLNLMMAVILNSAMLDTDTLFSSLRFTQKHSHSTLTLTQTNSIWLKLIHSDSTWWWQPSWIWPSWILPSWIWPFCTKLWLKLIQSDSNSFILTQLDDGSHLELWYLKFGHLGISHLSFSSQTHSHLPRLVPTICIKKNLHSFILTQLDDGSHLEFYHVGFRHCHLWFRHLLIFSQIHTKHSHSTLNQTNSIWLKLIHSHLTWWWQPSWILPSWIQPP